ncbi:Crp/Fnr family transcriptional regulator [Niastella yeongjuensis]|uniref:Crp/Fnr family transcriptional regulator n=1 Tax=Niastella yeongjuensis TaxID=354355 RepID=A0A1V9EUA2_9BACT|nr:Crp/Fnr family transcriptional regulator [Niastella yeongjuensis]OQP49736.1 Crp/Fnr family transcriptional regulator [Niastella yeongjuensis]SEP40742.1 cAMP-binding domain of CRP or a regulatory subunit of cAMP-dependent protein kinases [Niastella yeongjuensis]
MEALFNSLAFFVPVGEPEKEIIATLFTEKQFKKGEPFLLEGKVCRQVGFISKGLMRYFLTRDGEEKTFYFAREYEFVSNYESFVPQIPSLKSIEALEDTTAYVISYDNLNRLYATMANGERMGRLIMEQVFVQALQNLNSFYSDTPEQRYEKLLQTHPDLQQRIPQYYIASCVGVKPQSLSRIRKRLSLR